MMCPNCTKEAAGLYTSETGIIHCGCYYEGDPGAVDWHVSTDIGVLDHCPVHVPERHDASPVGGSSGRT
jgi:hypothetical protein